MYPIIAILLSLCVVCFGWTAIFFLNFLRANCGYKISLTELFLLMFKDLSAVMSLYGDFYSGYKKYRGSSLSPVFTSNLESAFIRAIIAVLDPPRADFIGESDLISTWRPCTPK